MSMSASKARIRIQELTKKINFYNQQYHTDDKSVITDSEYDILYAELKELEKQYPKLITDNSPTIRVGAKLLGGFKKINHHLPMLSLSNALNENDFSSFYEKILEKNNSANINLYAEPKFDGLAISIDYKNGEYFSASTRGDGSIGEDVTSNIKTIKSLPLTLKGNNIPSFITIRAEVYISKNDFDDLNKKLIKENQKPFANPRNVAAGSIRQLDPIVASRRNLQIFFHGIASIDKKYNDLTHSESMRRLKKYGLMICEHNKLIYNLNDAFKYFQHIDSMRESLPYEIDGVVFKVDEIKLQNLIGSTSKAPKWSIAYKFQSAEAVSELLDVTFQIGRTGVITPVAELKPNLIGGVIVSRATLHNMDEINKRDIHIGDFVYVKRAGDVIPAVDRVCYERRKLIKKIVIPKKCPSCGTPIIKISNQSIYKCTNEYECLPQIKQSIFHFASRKAMNIPGLGESLIDTLVNEKIISNFSDLYSLTTQKLIELDRIALKSSENILSSLEKSKSISFDRFIYALGIKEVGFNTAKILSNNFSSIKNLINSNQVKLEAIKDIGPIVTKNILDFFHIKRNISIIDKLIKAGINVKYPKVSVNKKYSNKTFVITGTFNDYSRDEIIEIISNGGGTISNSVSKNTHALILGDKPGSKYQKAKDLNIEIINEKKLTKLL